MLPFEVTLEVVDRVTKIGLFKKTYSLRRVPKVNDTLAITVEDENKVVHSFYITAVRVVHDLDRDNYFVFATKN